MSTPPNPAKNPSKFGENSVLRFADFRALLLGRLTIGMANNMQVVAIGWQIWSLTNSPLALGLVGLCGFLPLFAAALFAGHLIDRFERQKILTLCYLAHFISGVGLVLVVTFGGTRMAGLVDLPDCRIECLGARLCHAELPSPDAQCRAARRIIQSNCVILVDYAIYRGLWPGTGWGDFGLW